MKELDATEGKGQGLRKAILINEHFVVYSVPAIAIPINRPVDVAVTVRSGSGIQIFFEQSADGEMIEDADVNLRTAVKSILKVLGLSEEDRRFLFICRGELAGWSGLGSSAAVCVAIARALSNALNLGCSEDQINRTAYLGEKVFASNPSGIDNTVATYGRMLWYQRNQRKAWEFITPGSSFWLVIGSSGFPSLTRDQVEKVAHFKNMHSDKFDQLCHEANLSVIEARKCMEKGDFLGLGVLMNKSHYLLQQLGVSNESLDKMVTYCNQQGAFGSKLTGAGGGGSMIALVEGSQVGAEIVKGLKYMGYEAFCVQVGQAKKGKTPS